MPKSNVITVEPVAGQWIVYGPGYFSVHEWRSLAILTAERLAVGTSARVIVVDR